MYWTEFTDECLENVDGLKSGFFDKMMREKQIDILLNSIVLTEVPKGKAMLYIMDFLQDSRIKPFERVIKTLAVELSARQRNLIFKF